VNVFWPALLLGGVFIVLGSLTLVFRRRALQVLHRRYREAQERQPQVQLPGEKFLPILAAAIIAFGMIAIALGLTTSLRT
jgi:hypothetical protein